MKRPNRLRAYLHPHNGIALVLFLVCVGVGWWLFSHLKISDFTPAQLFQLIHALGWMGVLAFIGMSALAIVVSPIPSAPMTLTAGAVWGSLPAGTYAAIGIFSGSLMAYFIGRTLGRATVRALTGKIIYLSKQRGEVYLGWLMFVSHLCPVLPFDLVSYGAGISGLSLPIYASSTLLGIVPGTFLLTYLGAVFKARTSLGIMLLAGVLLVFIVLSWGVHRHNWLGLKDVMRLE